VVGVRPLAPVLLLAAALAAADDIARVANPALDELSGLAVSLHDPSLLWGHNDTGSGPVLYRLGPGGEDLGTVDVPQAQANDWEDIAAFEDAGGPALLIADVGDNLAMRSHVTLYAVRDPGREGDTTELLWKLDFRYADGPRDCEAVAVDAAAREIVLVTKRDVPARVYRLPLPATAPREVLIAEFLGTVPHLPVTRLLDRVRAPLRSKWYHRPTALDISRDGTTAALVTPRNAYFHRRTPGEGWGAAFAQPGVAVPLSALEQLEAGAWSADGRWLHVGGEGEPGEMAVVAAP
jgi:hypothetical protein